MRRALPIAFWALAALAMMAVVIPPSPAHAAFRDCSQICSYSPPSTACTCSYPGGSFHPGCEHWELYGCGLGLTASMSFDAPQDEQDEAVMSFDSQPLLAAPEADPSPSAESDSAPATTANRPVMEPATQPAEQRLGPSSD